MFRGIFRLKSMVPSDFFLAWINSRGITIIRALRVGQYESCCRIDACNSLSSFWYPQKVLVSASYFSRGSLEKNQSDWCKCNNNKSLAIIREMGVSGIWKVDDEAKWVSALCTRRRRTFYAIRRLLEISYCNFSFAQDSNHCCVTQASEHNFHGIDFAVLADTFQCIFLP